MSTLVVDLLVGGLIVAAAVHGARVGLGRVLPAAGFALGALLGTRVPLLVGEDLDADFALVIALPAALIIGAAGAAVAETMAARANRVVRRRRVADSGAGTLLAGSAAVVAAWALAPALSEIESTRDPIARSELLGRFNAVLTPAGPVRTTEPPPINELPTFAGRTPAITPGDPGLLSDPDVLRAERSVVKIHLTGCDGSGGGVGSGWVASNGVVVTNAHVVAATSRIEVQPGGTGARFDATVIWFHGEHDIAALRVPRLPGLPALVLAPEPRAGTAGVTLGYPRGRRAIRRARVGPTTDRLNGSLGGPPLPGVSAQISGRLVTTIRGRSQPGSSGGPVVDEDGRVITTVFAGSFASSTLGVPNRFARTALRRAGPRVRMGAGDC